LFACGFRLPACRMGRLGSPEGQRYKRYPKQRYNRRKKAAQGFSPAIPHSRKRRAHS